MSAPPAGLAAAAERLIGAPFRLHGRDPHTGLDCIGVVILALRAAGCDADIGCDYQLRMRSITGLLAQVDRLPLTPADALPAAAGDVLLVQVSACQHHCLIQVADGYIHAHAGLRRVVLSPQLPAGTVLRRWRLCSNR